MTLGVVWSLLASAFGYSAFTIDWIKPFGVIFINLLKVVAVPLVIVTIIGGVASLSSISSLTRIGSKTLAWFTGLTVISATLGLIICLAFSPGKGLSIEKRDELRMNYSSQVESKSLDAKQVKDSGPLKILQDIVPENFFAAAANNRSMLQIIFFSVLFGIGMVIASKEKIEGIRSFMDGANEVIIIIVNLIMKFAPYGVFALIAGLIADLAGDRPGEALDLFKVLGAFALTFIFANIVLMLVVYPILIKYKTNHTVLNFFKKLIPAQLVAFSTSSSAATLPVTMECTEKSLGVKSEIAGFVLPLGITINMNGTAIHQALSAIFIAHAFGHDLSFAQYLIIIVTSSLASMGAPGVPGSGLIMMLMVLGAIGVEEEGLALILAIDRPLDMIRTIPNVVGDALVASIISKSEAR